MVASERKRRARIPARPRRRRDLQRGRGAGSAPGRRARRAD